MKPLLSRTVGRPLAGPRASLVLPGLAIPLLAGAVLIACGGGADGETETDPGTGGGGGEGGGSATDNLTADEYYREVVHPELAVSCVSCHSSGDPCIPQFMQESAKASYDALRAEPSLLTHPENSDLILHGAHTGPALSRVQEEIVTIWLDKERPEPLEGESVFDQFAEFGDCMDTDDYLAAELYKWAYQQTNAGPCGGCHRTGEAGTWLSYNQEETFFKNAQLPWIKRMVRAEYDGNGNFVDLVASDRFVTKIEQANQCGDHPAANLDSQPERKQAVTTFVSLTKARWEAGKCDEANRDF